MGAIEISDVHAFFNVIRLPEGKVDEAFEAWKAVGRYMETQEQFLASVQNPDIQALSQVLTDLGVERTAGLYDAVHTFGENPSAP